MPEISVIVPVYQAEKFVEKCVESVKNQTFSDWELLLVDDGCTDGRRCRGHEERVAPVRLQRAVQQLQGGCACVGSGCAFRKAQ